MPNDHVSYKDSGYFSTLINDYLDRQQNVRHLYNRYPEIGNFEQQILEKKHFEASHRDVLVSTLEDQYKNTAISALTSGNVELIRNEKTFTVTTGHQLNLFSGPLYFIYKIVTAINLAKILKNKFPQYDFVPIYWMATEDHDFEEISYFNFRGKKFRWNTESSGPVGRLSTDGLNEVYDLFAADSGAGDDAKSLQRLFRESYLEHRNLADATRHLANTLFGAHGLVIIDADNAALKKLFIPYFKVELLHQTAYSEVQKTVESIKHYGVQVNPREINLFYIEDNLRERIVLENGIYKINNTAIQFSELEILDELAKHPEKFSPNVIMRPLYQEVILPNLCYIGGGGEIAYWLELKSFFEAAKVPFPILLLRNSALLVTQKQADKADKLELEWRDLFMRQADLINKKARALSAFSIDLTPQKDALRKQFDDLHKMAALTDVSFSGAVNAQEAMQLKGIENLEKRLLTAQKRKLADSLKRITDLQDTLFPNESLQERQTNFSEFYNDGFIEMLLINLQPTDSTFRVVTVP